MFGRGLTEFSLIRLVAMICGSLFLKWKECIIFHGFFAGDPNEVANGEVENGSTALRRFFSSKIPRNRDNKREDPPGMG